MVENISAIPTKVIARRKALLWIICTIKHSPQLNGAAERINLTVMNKVRAMLNNCQLSIKMWEYAAEKAAYLINRSPTITINVTPAKKWFGHKPNLSNLAVFGTVVYTKMLGHLKKMDNRGRKGIFVGYSKISYRIWNPITRTIRERNVYLTDQFENKRKQ